MLKHYVEYLYPGFVMCETSTREIPERTVDACLPLPRGAFGLRFFSRQESEIEGELLIGNRKDLSPCTFFGRALTLEEVKAGAIPGDNHILIQNMQGNKFNRVCQTIRGNVVPLREGDTVIPATE
jgi:hypothetical protein